MAIAVLGPLSVDGDAAVLGARDRVVLAALAVRAGGVVSTERLADALWGERPPASWSKVVQGCVVRLRKALGSHAIETMPHGYRLVLPLDEIDAHRFERLVRRGQELLTLGEPERAAHVIGEALALWRGRALVDLEGWEEGRIAACRLEELRLDAEEVSLDAALRAGRYREVLAEAQARVAEEPLREWRWALLARAQYQAGRQGEALRTLHGARTVLASQLGLEPGPDLVALEGAILRQDPAMVAATALPEPSTTCPYLGLVAYDVGDADSFFGRDADVAACLRRLATAGVLAVVGPSGSGKSSLVRAGVAASLERENRRVVVITPGAHPMDAITALSGSAPVPVLVVDQCEEVVVLCTNAGEQARFFAALASQAERGTLVVALRADRLGELSAHPAFARLVEQGLYLLSEMSEVDLRAAIEGPARQSGLILEPGLVDLLVREVEGEPGALPLLSHALRRTWERREVRTLTVTGYRDTGGIRGAVAQSAEELYERVPPDQRAALRDLLLRLVVPSPEGQPVRGRVPRRMVATDPQHERLIELLVGARLVTSDDGVVELAHEALARAWPRLRGWLDDDVEGQRVLRHLTVAADTWEAMGRPDAELYRGVRLAQALDWRNRTTPDITHSERAFLDASGAAAEVELRTSRRTTRRMRTLVVGLAAALVLALIAGTLAVLQGRDADQQAVRAARDATLADAARLASQARALPVDQRSLALLLAIEGRRLDASAETDGALQEALARVPPGLERLIRVGGLNGFAGLSPDQRLLAAPVPRDSTVRIIELESGRVLHRLDSGRAGALNVASFSPDGKRVVSGSGIGVVRIWNVADGKPLGPPLDAGEGTVWGVFDPTDSTKLFTISANSVVRWDMSEPQRPVTVGVAFRFPTEPTEITLLRVSPDGRRLAAAGLTNAQTFAWDVDTGRLLQGPLAGVPGPFTPDGTALALVRTDHVAFVDPATGAEHGPPIHGFRNANPGLAISPDGQRVAVTDLADNSIRVFDRTTGEQVSPALTSLGTLSFALGFLDRERVLVSGSEQLAVWRFAERAPALATVLPGHHGPVHAQFTPDNSEVVTTGGDDHLISRWSAVDGRYLGRLLDKRAEPARDLAFSPDGETVAVDHPDGSIGLWNVGTGQRVGRIRTRQPAPIKTTWSPTGSVLATSADDLSLVLWDVTDPRHPSVSVRLQVGTPQEGDSLDSVFTPDGDIIVASRFRLTQAPAAIDTSTAFVDVERGQIVRAIDRGGISGGSVFSPDGRTLITMAKRSAPSLALVDVPTGKTRAVVAQNAPMLAAAFVERGTRIATVRAPAGTITDGSTLVNPSETLLELWDATTLHPIGEPMSVPDHVPLTAHSNADGTKLVTGSRDDIAILWDLDPRHWETIACRIAGRNLTRAEWNHYLPDHQHHATCPVPESIEPPTTTPRRQGSMSAPETRDALAALPPPRAV